MFNSVSQGQIWSWSWSWNHRALVLRLVWVSVLSCLSYDSAVSLFALQNKRGVAKVTHLSSSFEQPSLLLTVNEPVGEYKDKFHEQNDIEMCIKFTLLTSQ